jgi:hydroxyacylglutathione hydrolase
MNIVLFGRKTKTLAPAEAWAAHGERGLVLVDVRQPQEWRSGVVPGALRVPLHELSHRIGELPSEGTVAFVCRSGHRSLLAARRARRRGIDVASVKGGMVAWSAAGMPTLTPDRDSSPKEAS